MARIGRLLSSLWLALYLVFWLLNVLRRSAFPSDPGSRLARWMISGSLIVIYFVAFGAFWMQGPDHFLEFPYFWFVVLFVWVIAQPLSMLSFALFGYSLNYDFLIYRGVDTAFSHYLSVELLILIGFSLTSLYLLVVIIQTLQYFLANLITVLHTGEVS